MVSVLAFFALLVPCSQGAVNAVEPTAVRAWFTDAVIDGSWQGSRPADALPDAPGTVGNGVLLERSAPVENPLFQQDNGLVSFWIKPKWDGNDGKRHTLLRIGDPHRNGLLVDKAASGIYPIRTSLQPAEGVTEVVKPEIPDAVREKNLRPVAVAPEEIKVKCGEEFSIDGAKSYDPEGQPLIYRWRRREGGTVPESWAEPVLKGKAPDEPGEAVYWFYVIDGLRVSEPITVRVIIEER